MPAAEAPAIVPPSAPVKSSSDVAAAAAKTTINVSSLPATSEPSKPAKPGSARAKIFGDLQKKVGIEPPPPVTPAPRKPASEVAKPEDAAHTPEGGEPAVSPDGKASPPEGATDPKTQDVKPAKANPWKLLDEYKGRLAKAEKDLAYTKSLILPEADRKTYYERISKSEARVKELEDEIRFVDYRKSAEFNEKYQKPYEDAWHRAMAELKEIHVTDVEGNTRQASADDLLQLVNLPLGQAREVADAAFGKFADDVMNFRKELRSLFDAQNAALEDAKKNGEEREKQRQEQAQRSKTELNSQVYKLWKAENEKALAHEKYGSYFKPREGDQEWNQRLAKGSELVDRAFAENPLNPNLTAEQRADIIKRHAAVRNRAASWGAIRYENETLKARIATLEKELAEFNKSTPPNGGTTPGESAPGQPHGRAAMMGALQKLAK